MSAGQHERVEVDVDPAKFVDEDDLGEQGGADPTGGGSRAPSRSNFFEMLQATEPAESPEQQDGTLSTSAAWHQHAELAIKKITGSSGTPAWLNLAMAAILAVVQGNAPTPTASADGDEQHAQDASASDGLGGEGNVEVA